MKRLAAILILFCLSLAGFEARAQDKYAQLDSLLNVYCTAMQMEPMEVKEHEIGFMIESAHDSLTREHIARELFNWYADSKLMGEEALAIYIWDNWFADGPLSIGGEFVRMDAEIFVTFNRPTLIGNDAPVLELYDIEGQKVRIPSEGRSSVLFFFDTSCSKCRLEIAVMPAAVKDVDFDLDFFAVYCGSDREAWDEFRAGFDLANSKVRVVHLWDPEMDSGYQLEYGVVSTPKMYLVEPQGTIIARRLEPESLKEMLAYAGAIQNIYEQFKDSE